MRDSRAQRRYDRDRQLNSESITDRALRRSRIAFTIAAYSAAAAFLALAALLVSRTL
ncbi:hypothetical protein AB0B28_08220 [Glycomyces sp. NPDC046736]|uniref:hypothetical protein n=1 Tax=Glycomyces sp. NPDC046736 TaxID=3155615 RepID=UPI0033CDCBAB